MPDAAGRSRTQDLLLELFSEEIPARMQARAAADLRRLVTDALVERGLTYAHAAAFATPRRLTLALTGLPAVTPDMVEERKGPRVDAPEKAVEGFLRSTGLARHDLEAREDRKGTVWFATIRREGRPAANVIAEVVPEVIRSFPWPKSMRWGEGSLRWVRPLHAIVCILSDEGGAHVVPFEVDGIASGDVTRGHRFMACPGLDPGAPGPIRVTGFEDYVEKLEAAKVVLDPETRAEKIAHDAAQLAFAQGLEVVEDKGLMAEVAGLVEWPVVLMGRIEERFLDLPPEVLRTSMKEHQKFFSVRNPASGRIEGFLAVANIEAPDGGRAILAGNARVLAARLADARFFWENDLRVATGPGGLEAMAEPLRQVTFHSKLGTQWERIERIAALAREIAPHVGADPETAYRAARIAKADLASEMVYEFPELQGVMGRYYAKAASLPDEIANAAEGHYRPLGPSDAVPTEPVTVAVALADKIDLLTGMWAIDEKPTGSKDPFALRRAALGVIRITHDKLRYSLCRLFFSGLKRVFAQHDYTPYRNFLELEGDVGVEGLSTQVADDLLRDELAMTVCQWFGKNPKPHLQNVRNLVQERDRVFAERQIDQLKLAALRKEFRENVSKAGEQLDPFGMVWEYQVLEPGEHDERWEEVSAWVESLYERISSNLLSFLADRLKVHLRDQGIRHDVIQACFELGGQDDLVLLVDRVKALQSFLQTEDGEHLLTGYRRANNIIRQARAETPEAEIDATPDPALFRQPEETALADALARAEAEVADALGSEDFTRAMAAMARLRPPIDAVFDHVTVNAEDPDLRLNRLRLMARIRDVMRQVAVWDAIEG